MRFLVDKGADVNSLRESDASTVLQSACLRGAHLDCIRLLLDEGADVNAPPAAVGYTALQYAVARGSMNVVGLLLDYEADVNAISGIHKGPPFVDDILWTFIRAIDIAVWNSGLDMVHFLIAAGARSSRPGLTGFDGAVKLATSERHFAITALLLKHADSHRRDRMEAERKWLQANPDACMYEDAHGQRLGRRTLRWMLRAGSNSEDIVIPLAPKSTFGELHNESLSKNSKRANTAGTTWIIIHL